MAVNKARIRKLSHPFPMLYDGGSQLLILGSFPSIKAVVAGYYYGNPHNRFYRVMSKLIGEDLVDVPWSIKKKLLLEHRIALCDVIGSCEIYNSSDAAISDIEPARLDIIFNSADIRLVACNGAKAYEEYMRYFSHLKIPVVLLPSTSPANARMRVDDLVRAWRQALRGAI